MSGRGELYEIKLHEKLYLQDDTHVLRVPGGWVYTIYQLSQELTVDGGWTENYIPSSVFVPYNNEFEWS